MYETLKSLFLVASCLLVSNAAASGVRQNSIIHDSSHMTGQHSPKAPSRLERLQKAFFGTPLDQRTRISSAFGYRRNPVSGEWKGHQGLDYPAPGGTPIRATAQGKISFIGIQNGYGKVIYIKHSDRYSTVYAHQSRFKDSLKKGENIKKGQIIGYVGSSGVSSGPHLHYELRVNNQPVDPIRDERRLAAHTQK